MVFLEIEKVLEKKNKTKYWLVKEMESSYQVINDLVNNRTKSIRFETIDKLCKLLECTPDDLIKYRKSRGK